MKKLIKTLFVVTAIIPMVSCSNADTETSEATEITEPMETETQTEIESEPIESEEVEEAIDIPDNVAVKNAYDLIPAAMDFYKTDDYIILKNHLFEIGVPIGDIFIYDKETGDYIETINIDQEIFDDTSIEFFTMPNDSIVAIDIDAEATEDNIHIYKYDINAAELNTIYEGDNIDLTSSSFAMGNDMIYFLDDEGGEGILYVISDGQKTEIDRIEGYDDLYIGGADNGNILMFSGLEPLIYSTDDMDFIWQSEDMDSYNQVFTLYDDEIYMFNVDDEGILSLNTYNISNGEEEALGEVSYQIDNDVKYSMVYGDNGNIEGYKIMTK